MKLVLIKTCVLLLRLLVLFADCNVYYTELCIVKLGFFQYLVYSSVNISYIIGFCVMSHCPNYTYNFIHTLWIYRRGLLSTLLWFTRNHPVVFQSPTLHGTMAKVTLITKKFICTRCTRPISDLIEKLYWTPNGLPRASLARSFLSHLANWLAGIWLYAVIVSSSTVAYRCTRECP